MNSGRYVEVFTYPNHPWSKWSNMTRTFGESPWWERALVDVVRVRYPGVTSVRMVKVLDGEAELEPSFT